MRAVSKFTLTKLLWTIKPIAVGMEWLSALKDVDLEYWRRISSFTSRINAQRHLTLANTARKKYSKTVKMLRITTASRH